MTRKVYVVEWKAPTRQLRSWDDGPATWEPYRAFTHRDDAEATMVSNAGGAYDRRIQVYVPRKAVRHD